MLSVPHIFKQNAVQEEIDFINSYEPNKTYQRLISLAELCGTQSIEWQSFRYITLGFT